VLAALRLTACLPLCPLPRWCSDLSEERAAALLDAAQRTRYLPCSAAGGKQGSEQGPAVAGDVLSQWPEAGLEAVQGSCMPQVRRSYGGKSHTCAATSAS
jgi:hypothetical protein